MEKSGFFNSSGGDRVYQAEDFAAYFGSLVTNGIFYQTSDNLKVLAGSGMNVTVSAGAAFINGYHYRNTDTLDLALSTADGVNPRIDRVILRWSNADRSILLALLSGTAASTPLAPELTRNSETYELGLAEINVAKGAIALTSDNITDTRLNTTLCGLVNSLVSAVYE